MKKIIKLFSSIALIFILVCIVTSCNGEKKPPITDEPPIDITPTPTPEETIKDIAELIAKYPNQLKSFLENEMIDDMVYVPTEKDYVDLDLVYASWYLGRITDSKLSYVSLAFTVKLDDTKRGYYVTDTKFENNPIDLNLIAKYDKTSSTNNFFPDSIWVGQVESLTVLYDAKEKQNDTKFLADLYGSGALREDIVSIDYVNETFQVNDHTHSYTSTKFNETKHWKECSCGEKMDEETHTFGEWTTIKEASYTEQGQKKRECSKCEYEETKDIPIKELTDMLTFIQDNNDIINANLETQYQSVLKSAFRRAYGTDRYKVLNYRWDLGEVANGKIQNLKMTLTYYDNTFNATLLEVYDVKLNEAIEIKTLLDDTAMASIKTTVTAPTFTYTYNPTKQHDMDEVWAKLAELELKGFEYEEVLYRWDSGSTEFGSSTIYTILYLSNDKIKQVRLIIKDSSTNEGKISNLVNGYYRVPVNERVEIDFTLNQLKEVDLTAPTDPNSIEFLIYYHNDEITANLKTHYENAVKKAYGRYYDTDRFTMISYRWDLGEVVEGKIQNLKVILNYHNNVASVDILHVHNVILNEAIEMSSLLDATTMSNTKATYSSVSSYTYDATKQHDMDEVWAKLAELELKGFEYEEALYTRTGGSVEFGGATGYTISYIDKRYIKEITVIIKATSTNFSWLKNLQNGNYKVLDTKEIDFTSNQLKEVDLTIE